MSEKKQLRIYCSGPMSMFKDTDWNYPAFNAAASLLRQAGIFALNPADKGTIDGWTWSDYMRHDIPEVVASDGVAVLPRWWQSPGARFEVDTALRLGLPVRRVDQWLTGDLTVDGIVSLRMAALQTADADFVPRDVVRATVRADVKIFDPWGSTQVRELPA